MTSNTRTIHNYAESWHSDREKRMIENLRKFNNYFGEIKAVTKIYAILTNFFDSVEDKGLLFTIFNYSRKVIKQFINIKRYD